MILPNKVIIYDKECEVVKNSEQENSAYDGEKIYIGTKTQNRIASNFLHEVLEAIIVENMCRYRNSHNPYENGDLMFVFDHKEFENIVAQFSMALKDVLK